MKLHQIDDIQIQNMANNVLCSILDGLVSEGYITEAQSDEIAFNYSIMLENKSWLPPFLSNWLGITEDSHMRMRLVKAVGRKKV